MEKLKLVKPNKYFEQEAKEYIKEFMDFKSHINGIGELVVIKKILDYQKQ